MKCPGQDRAFWKPEDLRELPCPHCGEVVEFMKDDFYRKCPKCGMRVCKPCDGNDCTAWCSAADKCLGIPASMLNRPGGSPKGEKAG